MSRSFRPVRIEYGTHSSEFVNPNVLIALLQALAKKHGFATNQNDTIDRIEWVVPENGQLFLAALRALTLEEAVNLLEDECSLSANEAEDIDPDDLKCLIDNMHGLASLEWLKELDGEDLRLWID